VAASGRGCPYRLTDLACHMTHQWVADQGQPALPPCPPPQSRWKSLVRRQHKGSPSHPSPVHTASGASTPDDSPEDLAAWSLLLQPEDPPPFLPTSHSSDSESTTATETCSELSSSASFDEQGPGHAAWTTRGAAAGPEGVPVEAPAVVSPAAAAAAPPLLGYPVPDAPVVVWSFQPPPVALHPGAPFPFPYPYAVAFQPPPPPFINAHLPLYSVPPHPHPAPFGVRQVYPTSLGGQYPEAGGT
jgi:hypothetical protein